MYPSLFPEKEGIIVFEGRATTQSLCFFKKFIYKRKIYTFAPFLMYPFKNIIKEGFVCSILFFGIPLSFLFPFLKQKTQKKTQ
jgi:hypothetical protein